MRIDNYNEFVKEVEILERNKCSKKNDIKISAFLGKLAEYESGDVDELRLRCYKKRGSYEKAIDIYERMHGIRLEDKTKKNIKLSYINNKKVEKKKEKVDRNDIKALYDYYTCSMWRNIDRVI